MTIEEYKSKEALLFILYEHIEKICYNKFLLIEKDNQGEDITSIIDVDNNRLKRSSNSTKYYHANDIIIEITKLNEKVIPFGITKHKLSIFDTNLNIRYTTTIELYLKYWTKDALLIRKLGQFILIETHDILILLDNNYNEVVRPGILYPLKNKIWFINGYHMYISFIRMNYRLEIITNYYGDKIISFGRIELDTNTYKVITKLGDGKFTYPEVSLEVFGKLCSNKYNDINKSTGLRDGYITHYYDVSNELYTGCILKTGEEIIEPRKNISEIIQISDNLYMVCTQDKTSNVEIIHKTKGVIIKSGIIQYYDKLLSKNLPIYRFYVNINNTLQLFVLGNDYKLYNIETKGMYEYNINDIANAFSIKQLDNNKYLLNLYEKEIEVDESIKF